MSTSDHYKLIQKYRSKGLLVDTNLLLLLFVGSVDPQLVSKFERTKSRGFTANDFQLLQKLICFFGGKVITTPNILTEVSNLSRKLHGELRVRYFTQFGKYVRAFQEKYSPSKDCSTEAHFIALGLTDSSIVLVSEKNFLVLTDDFPLAATLGTKKIDVLNFNHLRNMTWEMQP
jgi:rRNA-processing protein FCF1